MSKKNFIFEKNNPQSTKIGSNIKIIEVTNLITFLDFFKIPWKIYKNDKNWVPPLWSETRDIFSIDNLFWKHSEVCLFIAYKENKPVGRIAGIIDHDYPKLNEKKIGFFGFFECINDSKIANSLFKLTEEWLDSKNIKIMRGPINCYNEHKCGFLLEGFNEPPYLLSAYSPKYYLEFAKNYKFKKSTDLVTYNIDLTKPIPKPVFETTIRCLDNNITIHRFNKSNFNKEIKMIYEIIKDTFKGHWGYSPNSYEEFLNRFGIKDFKLLIKSNLLLIAKKDGKPIGIKWVLPNYNIIIKKLNGKIGLTGAFEFLWYYGKIKEGKFVLTGIKKDFRSKGVGTYLNYHVILEMKKLGYKKAEYGWIEENNIASRKLAEKLGGKLHKKYRIFEKEI